MGKYKLNNSIYLNVTLTLCLFGSDTEVPGHQRCSGSELLGDTSREISECENAFAFDGFPIGARILLSPPCLGVVHLLSLTSTYFLN